MLQAGPRAGTIRLGHIVIENIVVTIWQLGSDCCDNSDNRDNNDNGKPRYIIDSPNNFYVLNF